MRKSDQVKTGRMQLAAAGLRLLCVACLLVCSVWFCSRAQGAAVSPSPKAKATTRPTRKRTPRKSLFFPAVASGRQETKAPVGKKVKNEFVLVGVVCSGKKRAALIRYPATDVSRWVNAGEKLVNMTVVAVDSRGVEVQVAGRRRSLTIGQSSQSLDVDRGAEGQSFEVVGVCATGKKRFAMVRLVDAKRVVRVRVGDDAGSGKLASVNPGGIVLTLADGKRTIPVGSGYMIESKVR